MANVVMNFDFSKNLILELLYQNVNREIGQKDASRIIERILGQCCKTVHMGRGVWSGGQRAPLLLQ